MTLPAAALWLTGVEILGEPDNGEADETFVTAATVLSALLATLLVITVMPGSSILDLDIDVGIIILAFYVASIVWAALTVLLVNVFFTLWSARGPRRA